MKNLGLQSLVRRRLRFGGDDDDGNSDDRTAAAVAAVESKQRPLQQQHVVDICPLPQLLSTTAASAAATSTSGGDRVLLTNDGILARVDSRDGDLIWRTSLNGLFADEGDDEGSGGKNEDDDGDGDCFAGRWFGLRYVDSGDAQLVCFHSSKGAVVSASPLTGDAELVGEFENGLDAAAWSPDNEVLLLVTSAYEDQDDQGNDQEGADANETIATATATEATRKSVLLTMNSEWEVLREVNFETHDVDTDKVSVCWRPDSTLCAVSSVDAADSVRKIRIYDRDTLERRAVGRSEDGSGKLVPNLQGAAAPAWAGSGCSQLLAAVQRKGKKTYQVSFFEPNGLRHREFALRDVVAVPNGSSSNQHPACTRSTEVVQQLSWSADSDILAVTIRQESYDAVQLWHRSNYHWYLKKEFRFRTNDNEDDIDGDESGEGSSSIRRQGRIVRANFCPDVPGTLFVVFDSGISWNEYEVRWDTSTVCTGPSTSTAFVVDGRSLNVTHFDKALVPPPMFATSLDFEAHVSEVIFCRTPASSSLVAVVALSNGKLAVIDKGHRGKTGSTAGYSQLKVLVTASWVSSTVVDTASLRDFVVVDDDEASNRIRLVAIQPALPGSAGSGDCESLAEITLQLSGDEKPAEAFIRRIIPLEGRVLRMTPWLDYDKGALIQLQGRQLLEYVNGEEDTDGNVVLSEAEPLLEPCPWIAALRNVSSVFDRMHSRRERLVVGMSSKSRLFCHDWLLSDYASSFVLSWYQKYLCFTTSGSRGQLLFISLFDLHCFDPLAGADGASALFQGYEPRSIERGAKLVAVLPHKPQAVLQLPRGNLEGLYPRALVLRTAVLKIREDDYAGAFELMRRQKVDLNLIVDLDPKKFLEEGGHAEVFIEQVTNIDYLNLFISSLQTTDCTSTRFTIPSWWLQEANDDVVDHEPFDFEGKVNQTCQVLRSIMIEAERGGKTPGGRAIDKGHFLLPILSTYAKEDPPKLNDALGLIKEIALASYSPKSKKPPLFSDTAQSSIQYLAFLADYEMLFETALGMYDFEIARAVARNSQMDPKVYLPQLKRYRELPRYYARFEVDMRLKRYDSALRNLYESGRCEESVENCQADSSFDETRVVGNGFDECLSLMEDQHLHQLGLELFRDAEQRSRIMLSLGNYLMKERNPSAALNVFLAAEPPYLEEARGAARLCRDWGAFFTILARESGLEATEASLSKQRDYAHEVAKDIVSSSEGHFNHRNKLADAARVLLDYAKDPDAAIEILLQARMWNEAQRESYLHDREDLVSSCIDSAVSYASLTMDELEEKCEAFCTASVKFAESLDLRIRGEVKDDAVSENHDDSGSLFSVASNVSHLSTASNTSTGSSVSSVISIRSTTSFSLSGADEANRHKSKFNQLGVGDSNQKLKRNKKKKARSRSSKKPLPGSQQDLDNLLQTLRSNVVDDSFRDVIAETIIFLARIPGQLETSKSLYDKYLATSRAVSEAQIDRVDTLKRKRLEQEKKARRDGLAIDFRPNYAVVNRSEEEANSLAWSSLPDDLQNLFSYLRSPPKTTSSSFTPAI